MHSDSWARRRRRETPMKVDIYDVGYLCRLRACGRLRGAWGRYDDEDDEDENDEFLGFRAGEWAVDGDLFSLFG